jgi:hypothetical protein
LKKFPKRGAVINCKSFTSVTKLCAPRTCIGDNKSRSIAERTADLRIKINRTCNFEDGMKMPAKIEKVFRFPPSIFHYGNCHRERKFTSAAFALASIREDLFGEGKSSMMDDAVAESSLIYLSTRTRSFSE